MTSISTWRRPWISLLIGSAAMLCAGTLYVVGSYEEDIKDRLQFSQSETEFIGYVGDAGLYLAAPFTGALQDAKGPWISCLLASILLLVGYGGMALLVSARVASPVLLAASLALSGAGSGQLYVSALSANLQAFAPQYRGRLVGFLVSTFGLSASVYALSYRWLFHGANVAGFLAYMAFTTAAVSLLSAFFLYHDPQAVHAEHRDAPPVQHADDTPQMHDKPQQGRDEESIKLLATAGQSSSAQGNSGIDRRDTDHAGQPSTAHSSAAQSDDTLAGDSSNSRHVKAHRWRARAARAIKAHAVTSWRLFSTPSFLLLYTTFMLLAGNGLLVINNIGSITKAVLPSAHASAQRTTTSALVMLYSIGNCFGRTMVGVATDAVHVRRGWFIVASCLLNAATFAVAAVVIGSDGWAAALLLVIGCSLSYGCVWAVLPTCVSEMFGMQHFGQNWGCTILAPAGGGSTMNFIAGLVYDHARAKQSSAQHTCYGAGCFRGTFVVAVATAVCAAITAACVTPHTHLPARACNKEHSTVPTSVDGSSDNEP